MYFAHKMVEAAIKYEFGSNGWIVPTNVVHNGSDSSRGGGNGGGSGGGGGGGGNGGGSGGGDGK